MKVLIIVTAVRLCSGLSAFAGPCVLSCCLSLSLFPISNTLGHTVNTHFSTAIDGTRLEFASERRILLTRAWQVRLPNQVPVYQLRDHLLTNLNGEWA
jgi:hypothetical protein